MLAGDVQRRAKDVVTRSLRRAIDRPSMSIGLVIIVIMASIAIYPDFFSRRDPYEMDIPNRHQPPSSRHWFGTDDVGRDLYTRMVFGLRTSLVGASVVVTGALLLGTLIGLYGGYSGGIVDDLLMRTADIFLAFPGLIMAMTFAAILGPGLQNVMLGLIIIWWPQYARLSRAQVLVVRQYLFVEAAVSMGARSSYIMLRHILPNIWAPILVKGALDLGFALVLTSALSFLGLGVRPPQPELGAMVSEGRRHLLTSWWYSTIPGLTLFIAVLAINSVADGLRDLLDPMARNVSQP